MVESTSSPTLLPDNFRDGDLAVRRWELDDTAALHEAIRRNVEHLRPWMPWIAYEPQTIEQRTALIGTWEQDWRAGGDVVMGVFLDGEVAGSTGLHRRLGADGLEIGYWIDRDRVGRGLATRVARMLTSAAFTVPGIDRVEIPCDATNLRSRRVPEKLDYTFVGFRRAAMAAPAETGRQRVHRMWRSEWPSDQPATRQRRSPAQD